MNSTLFLSILTDWWQRLGRRLREARRYRQDQQVLAAMSDHELRDLGISHAEIAAAGRRFRRGE